MYRHFFTWCFFLFSFSLSSQAGLTKEELLRRLTQPVADTTRIDIYNELTWPIYSYEQPDSALFYGEKAVNLSRKLKEYKRLCVAHRRVGIAYSNRGDLKKAITHQEESYRLAERLHFVRGMYLALNNMGAAYLNNELLNKALSYFLRSLTYLEGTDEYANKARVYINCGIIYRKTHDTLKAKTFFMQAKHFAELANANELIITTNCDLASIHRSLKQRDSAQIYLAKARSYLTENASRLSKFNYYLTEALLQQELRKYEDALHSLRISSEHVGGYSDEITLLINIGLQYKFLHNYAKAMEHYKKAFELSRRKRMFDNLEYLTSALAEVYEKTNNLREYVAIMNLHMAYRDTNAQVNKAQEIVAQQLEFEYTRKHVADSVRFEQKDHLRKMELEVAEVSLYREKITRVFLFCILVLLLVLALFIGNRLRHTRKQKRIIEEQKLIVEQKNHEILDSINYAKHLQEAILPQLPNIKKYLPLDILYLPKDIIGGDFYFFENYNDKIFIAVCDCTGHGIPGAIMSVVCHHAVEKSIREFNLTDPAQILNRSRQLIIDSLNAAEQNIRDGMDCSLLVIDSKKRSATWAGAYNPLWILKGKNLTEIKADKHSVSYHEHLKDFHTHQLDLTPGSLIYLFTDGYADQFGGANAKKYKYKTLKEFLMSIADQSPSEQVRLLRENFYTWKGTLDQVDDVAIAVIKIDY